MEDCCQAHWDWFNSTESLLNGNNCVFFSPEKLIVCYFDCFSGPGEDFYSAFFLKKSLCEQSQAALAEGQNHEMLVSL